MIVDHRTRELLAFDITLREYGVLEEDRRQAILARILAFMNAADLPTIDGSAVSLSIEDPSLGEWERLARAFDPATAPTIDAIMEVLREPVLAPEVAGRVVVKQLGSVSAKRNAVVMCEGTRTVLAFSPGFLAVATAPLVRFLREHERAHLRLRHTDCVNGKNLTPSYNERAADSAAITWLEGARQGCVVLHTAALYFSLVPHSAVDTYPSSSERVAAFHAACPLNERSVREP